MKLLVKPLLESLEVFKKHKYYPRILGVQEDFVGRNSTYHLESLVRIERDGVQYLIWCRDLWEYDTDAHVEILDRFYTKCYMTKLLFRMPKEEEVEGYLGLYLDPDQRSEVEKFEEQNKLMF